ncbi:IclR family transcriptional regulator [Nocardia thailandica]
MPGPIQSIERAAAVLRLLARGPLPVGEVAAALGLAKPTVHGILRTLVEVGFADQDRRTGRYLLAPALHGLGTGYLDPNELRGRVLGRADALAARSGAAVRVAVPVDGTVTVVHHVFRPDNDLEQEHGVGEILPAHASALGKILLAYDPKLAAALRNTAPAALTHRTLVARPALERELAEVRSGGWAGEIEETRAGWAGVAAPLRTTGGLVVGALGVDGPVDSVSEDGVRPRPAVVEQVRDAARAASRDLGFAG